MRAARERLLGPAPIWARRSVRARLQRLLRQRRAPGRAARLRSWFRWPGVHVLLPRAKNFCPMSATARAHSSPLIRLREFLETVVAETRAKRIHIIAHSMGNVALNEALQIHGAGGAEKAKSRRTDPAPLPTSTPDLFQRTYRRLQKPAGRRVHGPCLRRATGHSAFERLRDRPQLGFIPAGGPKKLVDGSDLMDITAVNSDVFSLKSRHLCQ